MCLVYRLVFSQSLLSLDLIEAFLGHWDKQLSEGGEQVYIISYLLFPDQKQVHGFAWMSVNLLLVIILY